MSYRELETQHLKLRRFSMEDAPEFFRKLGGCEQVTRTMMWKTHQELTQSEQTMAKILRGYESGTAYCWAITLKDSGALIGRIDLLGNSFAYMLGESYWNKGYGTEAVKAVFDFGFRELGLEEIEADHFADNPASGAVMAKVGMTKIGITPGKYEKNGIIHDAVNYRITKEEWMK